MSKQLTSAELSELIKELATLAKSAARANPDRWREWDDNDWQLFLGRILVAVMAELGVEVMAKAQSHPAPSPVSERLFSGFGEGARDWEDDHPAAGRLGG